MEFESLDAVDVTYDNDTGNNQKEINIDDEGVKDRWSRYIGAMGIDAVKRQASSSVFLSGAGGLGIEIAKNIVLSGCKKFVLHDTKKTTHLDLASQFFLSEEDLNLNRAEASVKKLQQLNYYVKILASSAFLPREEKELEKFGLGDFNIVVLTNCDYETGLAVNRFCRTRGIHLIWTDLYGVFGRVMNDFGDEFAVNDKDGEDLKDCMIKSITSEGLVTVLENTRHNFQDGDEVVISEVEGMKLTISEKEAKSINDTVHTVKVVNPQTFSIGDVSNYSEYVRNGMAKQIKSKAVMKFNNMERLLYSTKVKENVNTEVEKVKDNEIKLVSNSEENISNTDENNKDNLIKDNLIIEDNKNISTNNESGSLVLDENLSIADFTKMGNSMAIHIGFEALDTFLKTNKSLPGVWNNTDKDHFLEICSKISSSMNYTLSESDLSILTYISLTCQVQFSPLAAFFGGVVAQEAIKAMTGKFTPINGMFFYDAKEVLPALDKDHISESISVMSQAIKSAPVDRLQGLLILTGPKVLSRIQKMKILVVGAGAIGCELLKNFAMLNVGTADGSIFVTDPDIIEVSNLNRQFLFREKHLRQPKSSTAGAAVIQMNSKLKGHIFAKLDKVCEETESIFTDKFVASLSLVANALDNITARRYVDSRCVTNRIPLLESGTLGAKGHVQVVMPNKTESYSSQQDPEVTTDIPQCTLKMFPEEAMHCIEWARDLFGKVFTQTPKSVNKLSEEGSEAADVKEVKTAVKHFKNAPADFEACVRIAREKFEKLFVNNIKQLMFSYPLDKKNKDGSHFWSLPKRPPVEVAFEAGNELHAGFIAAYSCLVARQFKIKIPYENPRDKNSKFGMAKMAAVFLVKEFKPNEEKAKEMQKQVEKEKKEKKQVGMVKEGIEDENNTHTTNTTNNNKEILLKDYSNYIKEFKLDNFANLSEKEKHEKEFPVEEFEKDNDANFHIDIIYSLGNLRCRNYKLDEMDWMKVKIKAGRIIPALATTTAAIAGLQSLELVKIAKEMDIEQIRNSFINLAIPYMQASEPGAVSTYKIKDDLSVTLWDRWEVPVMDKMTTSTLFEYLLKKFGIYPRDIFKGKKAIYVHTAYTGSLKEEIMSKPLKSLLGVDADDDYADVMVTFTSEEVSDTYLKNIPPVRILLK